MLRRSPQHLVSPAYTLLTRTPYVEASAPEAPAYEAPYEAPPKYEQLQPQYEAEAAFPNASAPQAEIPDFSQERPLEYGESNDAEDDTALASINPQNFSKVRCLRHASKIPCCYVVLTSEVNFLSGLRLFPAAQVFRGHAEQEDDQQGGGASVGGARVR